MCVFVRDEAMQEMLSKQIKPEIMLKQHNQLVMAKLRGYFESTRQSSVAGMYTQWMLMENLSFKNLSQIIK